MHWRKNQPALRWGTIRFIEAAEPLLLFIRTLGDDVLFVAFNLGATALTAPLPPSLPLQQIECPGPLAGKIMSNHLQLPGYAAIYARVVSSST